MRAPENERPPILGSWSKLYSLVILYLVLVIVAFAIFARSFRI